MIEEQEEQEAAELELFIQHEIEQERQDQHDLKMFYKIKQEKEEEVEA